MNANRWLFGLSIAMVLVACGGRHREVSLGSPIDVAKLLATPSQFDGVVVVTIGVAVVEFEHTALYPSAVVAEGGTTEDGIWLDLDPGSYAELDRKCVRVEGMFHAGDVGHMGIFKGEISPVQAISVTHERGENAQE